MYSNLRKSFELGFDGSVRNLLNHLRDDGVVEVAGTEPDEALIGSLIYIELILYERTR